ncbi:MAG: hypothetical protein KA250_14635 [Verrucomicrobiales bacterium]|jgi:hypothetical protein|nr:hypothetical protein [Verrucomicrobiales bacterium]
MKLPHTLLAALFLAGCSSVPVTDDDNRAYYAKYRAAEQAGTCHVHQVAMTKENVPISYGLPIDPKAGPQQNTRQSQFPFSRLPPLGGCVISEDSPKTAEISVCPGCVAAEQRWVRSHPWDRWARSQAE